MSFINGILSNKAIIIPVFAWFVAQMFKVISVIIEDRRIDYTRIFGAGGMPSSHSAFVVSLTTVVGRSQGWHSTQFAIAFAIAIIVMYDAAGVRRAAGQHAQILNQILSLQKHLNPLNVEKLKELLGHSPFEVVMGGILGIAMGLLYGA